ncbi:MAG: hypothetical protein M1492_09020 [Gammaproteobacteria bacterium]|uniref:hypothetical protein n=1 Tax=Acidithiobacillus ferrooxidans TaxID=920 RepID=UPI00214860AA|nr:hypothetical protein [Acidithiobacillus ferrooxidans]MCL4526594.1 hypothetical protein [Gammaproteobacteria bacterium]MCR1344257.1 hypothetical protein [Acidithiobacillus ferrooxidans]MCR1355199.1 hypothetical protein [Acidithiobacillus ferrooxidans]
MSHLPRPYRWWFLAGGMVFLLGWAGAHWLSSATAGVGVAILGVVIMVPSSFWGLARQDFGITPSALAHLVWLHRFYPGCSEVADLLSDPSRVITWREAYAAEKACIQPSKQTQP